jgi:diguanylate cyclase (GGDEF)-like protein
VTLGDEQGAGRADLGICESHIELGELVAAKTECANALRILSASQDADTVKSTRALMARIDLREGRPATALATLNAVLDQRGADLSPVGVAALYELRAGANAQMHHYRQAYDDLREYARRHAAANEAERHQQAGALRARFETDREIERNTSLARELQRSREQSKRQARELRWNAVVLTAGMSIIVLLIYFLIANRRFRKQLVKLASQDGLTGLPNRRRAAELATAALQTARTTGQPLVIAIIDMDHFKAINDRCGHATGDHVLMEFARAGGEALRSTDVLGRWGGEEFLLVMAGATLEVAVATLERLRTLVFGIRLPASGAGLRVSLSAGVAAFDRNVKSLDELIARADAALYAAKNDGRDLVRIADSGHGAGAHAIRRAQRN